MYIFIYIYIDTCVECTTRQVSARALSVFASSEAGGSAQTTARPFTPAAAALEFRQSVLIRENIFILIWQQNLLHQVCNITSKN